MVENILELKKHKRRKTLVGGFPRPLCNVWPWLSPKSKFKYVRSNKEITCKRCLKAIKNIKESIKMKKLNGLWLEFASEMKSKLEQKAKEGYTGWDGCDQSVLREMFQNNLKDEDWIDVANLAMLLWYRQRQ